MSNDTAGAAPAIQQTEVVEILPARIWIESDMLGGRHVVMQHEGDKPFTFASFGYRYGYTDNAGTLAAARHLTLALGAMEPIEQRVRTLEAMEQPTITPNPQQAMRQALTALEHARDWMGDAEPLPAAACDVRAAIKRLTAELAAQPAHAPDLRTQAQAALASFAGYRRELGDRQPCDAERGLRAALEQSARFECPDCHISGGCVVGQCAIGCHASTGQPTPPVGYMNVKHGTLHRAAELAATERTAAMIRSGELVPLHVGTPPAPTLTLTDELMDCIDRLGSEADTVDPRVWPHLRAYVPAPELQCLCGAVWSQQAGGWTLEHIGDKPHGPRWTHAEGGAYVEVARGKVQFEPGVSGWQPSVFYRSEQDGAWYARRAPVFAERFAPAADAPVPHAESEGGETD